MFDFLTRIGGSKIRPAQKSDAEASRPKYYQPERYYMRGPGPAWYAAHPEHAHSEADKDRLPSADKR